MAVGLESGLLTPVVKNAEKMNLRELMISLKDLTKKADEIKWGLINEGEMLAKPVIEKAKREVEHIKSVDDKKLQNNDEHKCTLLDFYLKFLNQTLLKYYQL